MSSTDSSILVPLTTAQISLFGSPYLSNISVAVTSEDKMDLVKSEMTNILMNALRITDINKINFTISSQAETLETLSTITNTLKIFLGGIAGISLFV